MAEGLGQDTLARRLATALAEEDVHLRAVERWLSERLAADLGAEMPAPEFGEPATPET